MYSVSCTVYSVQCTVYSVVQLVECTTFKLGVEGSNSDCSTSDQKAFDKPLALHCCSNTFKSECVALCLPNLDLVNYVGRLVLMIEELQNISQAMSGEAVTAS